VVCASVLNGCLIRVHFCNVDVINHYFCDLPPFLKLYFSNTYVSELLVLCFGTFDIFPPTLTILSLTFLSLPDPLPSLHQRQVQTLQHLQLSHAGGCDLWLFSIHVPAATCQLHGPKQSVLCVLFHFFFHVEPSDLQPEE
jgi:hypothetical protein